MTDRSRRKLLAILAADIAGYSRHIGRDEDGTIAALRQRMAAVLPIVTEHDGRVVDTAGDGILAEFPSAVRALEAGVAIQRRMEGLDAHMPSKERLRFRIGINVGDVVAEDNKIFGEGVNVAARLEQICPPGGVLVSGTAYDNLKGRLYVPVDYMGELAVKNIAERVRTYNVRLDRKSYSWRLRARRTRRFFPLMAGFVVLLALAAAAAWWLQPTDVALARASVAVLPFDNYGRDEASGRLADGITEDIVTDLARFPDFDVIARNSTAVYAGKPIDVRQVGKELSVRYVLEGSVQREANQIRVTAQLIDAGSGAHVWSERWERPATDVFAVQTEIVQQAVNRLAGTGVIMEAEKMAAARKRPDNLSAYERYLLARDRILNPSKERIDQAINLFKQALEMDPTLARAWVDLAWAYDQSTNYGADFATAHPLSLAAAQRAVEMDPLDAGAHAVLGNMLAYDDFARGKAELDNALRLNPGSSDILAINAGWASTFGEPERGARLADQAVRLNPNYPPAQSGLFYFAYFMAGRFDDALRTLERQPVENCTMGGWVIRAASYAAIGETEKARAASDAALEHYPDLTAEGFANEPGFNETERRKLAEGMRNAGFPPCTSPEKLAGKSKPFRLPECTTKLKS